jgi:Protein of unknown function (DUF1416)
VSRRWVTLAGVVLRDGAPAGQAYVTVADRDGNFTGERRTARDGDGAFSFELSPGRWRLQALAAGGLRAHAEVELGPGERREVVLELGPAGEG